MCEPGDDENRPTDDDIPVDEDIWGTDTLTADDFK